MLKLSHVGQTLANTAHCAAAPKSLAMTTIDFASLFHEQVSEH